MTNTFKVGDKVRPLSDLAVTESRGFEGVVTGFNMGFSEPQVQVTWETRISALSYKYSSVETVRKFKAGDRVYVPQPPYEGVHTIFQVLKDSEPESEFDYTLDRDWTKAVYESEIEALPTEFKEGEWVKVLEYNDFGWWANHKVQLYTPYEVTSPRGIRNPRSPHASVYGLDFANQTETQEGTGATVIKVDAPVSEPEKSAAAFVVGDRVRPNLAEKHNAQGWYQNYSEGTVVGVGEDIQVRHDHVTFDGGINGFVANWIPEALIRVDSPTPLDAALKALEDAQNAVDNAANVLSAASDQLDEARAQLKEAVK